MSKSRCLRRELAGERGPQLRAVGEIPHSQRPVRAAAERDRAPSSSPTATAATARVAGERRAHLRAADEVPDRSVPSQPAQSAIGRPSSSRTATARAVIGIDASRSTRLLNETAAMRELRQWTTRPGSLPRRTRRGASPLGLAPLLVLSGSYHRRTGTAHPDVEESEEARGLVGCIAL